MVERTDVSHPTPLAMLISVTASSFGTALLNRGVSIGFKQSKDKTNGHRGEYEVMRSKVLGELKNTFKPEFLNRIDEIIVFHPLRIEEMYAIVDLLLDRVRNQLSEQCIELIMSQAGTDFLMEKGFDAQYGARPLRRTIQRVIEDPLAEGILQGRFHPGDLVEGTVVDNQLVFQVRNRIGQVPAPASREVALAAGK
jgi:ATP-dependent Clp protease ATP-binding subunit ClpC